MIHPFLGRLSAKMNAVVIKNNNQVQLTDGAS
jgi:hypothetical protein